jgi:hypothetical protein
VQIKESGFSFVRGNKICSKAKLRLLGIRITASTHVESMVLLQR